MSAWLLVSAWLLNDKSIRHGEPREPGGVGGFGAH